MRYARRFTVGFVLVALIVVACGEAASDSGSSSGTPGPEDPEATVGDDVGVSPTEAAPGEAIEVTYADEDTGRTGCLALEVDIDDDSAT